MRVRTGLALTAIAFVLAAASVRYQQVGPERMVEGEGWCTTPAPCMVPVLGAGFPFPWMVDNPQVSVPNAIGVGEDDFRPGAFLMDALFFFAFGVLIIRIRREIRARRNAAH
jgi:hypothetical protein